MPFETLSTISAHLKTTCHEQLSPNTTTAIAQRNIQRTAAGLQYRQNFEMDRLDNPLFTPLPNLVECAGNGRGNPYTTDRHDVLTQLRCA